MKYAIAAGSRKWQICMQVIFFSVWQQPRHGGLGRWAPTVKRVSRPAWGLKQDYKKRNEKNFSLPNRWPGSFIISHSASHEWLTTGFGACPCALSLDFVRLRTQGWLLRMQKVQGRERSAADPWTLGHDRSADSALFVFLVLTRVSFPAVHLFLFLSFSFFYSSYLSTNFFPRVINLRTRFCTTIAPPIMLMRTVGPARLDPAPWAPPSRQR